MSEKIDKPSKKLDTGTKIAISLVLLINVIALPFFIYTSQENRNKPEVLGVSEQSNTESQSELSSVGVSQSTITIPNTVQENRNLDVSDIFGDTRNINLPKPKNSANTTNLLPTDEDSKLPKVSTTSEIYGKVVWQDMPFKGAVKGLNKGETCTLINRENRVNLITDYLTLMPADTFAVVNREVFEKLGGNPENETWIEILIIL